MNTIPDRRAKPRVACNYPAVIHGSDIHGMKYKENGKLANLSASGLYMLLNRQIEAGSDLSVIVLLCNDTFDEDTPKLATNGTVVRSELQNDGTYGIAVKFNKYRFQ